MKFVVVLSLSWLYLQIIPLNCNAGEHKQLPHKVRTALGCILAANYLRADLTGLGLKIGDSAWVRFHVGSIPGEEPSATEIQVAVYARDGNHGQMWFAEPNSRGGFTAIRNGYRLTMSRGEWFADEGNGGIGTYKVMSRFATTISRYPGYLSVLSPGGSECTQDQ